MEKRGSGSKKNIGRKKLFSEGFTMKQQKVAEDLAFGASLQEAAKNSDISKETIHNWNKRQQFRDLQQQYRDEVHTERVKEAISNREVLQEIIERGRDIQKVSKHEQLRAIDIANKMDGIYQNARISEKEQKEKLEKMSEADLNKLAKDLALDAQHLIKTGSTGNSKKEESEGASEVQRE